MNADYNDDEFDPGLKRKQTERMATSPKSLPEEEVEEK